MSPDMYLTFKKNIEYYTVTIYIDGDIWVGTTPLKPGKLTSKTELEFRKTSSCMTNGS